jgi:hypothetical protein
LKITTRLSDLKEIKRVILWLVDQPSGYCEVVVKDPLRMEVHFEIGDDLSFLPG